MKLLSLSLLSLTFEIPAQKADSKPTKPAAATAKPTAKSESAAKKTTGAGLATPALRLLRLES